MLITVTGGSGSGKSEYSENLLLKLDPAAGEEMRRFYIATMLPFGEEGERRIRRHRAMRARKGFRTVERYYDLAGLTLPDTSGHPAAGLLECMSNLAANEFFGEEGAGSRTADAVMDGIRNLKNQCSHLVVVTNEVFSDGISYDAGTEEYIRILAEINRRLAKESDVFAEVVYSIPVIHKGGSI